MHKYQSFPGAKAYTITIRHQTIKCMILQFLIWIYVRAGQCYVYSERRSHEILLSINPLTQKYLFQNKKGSLKKFL